MNCDISTTWKTLKHDLFPIQTTFLILFGSFLSWHHVRSNLDGSRLTIQAVPPKQGCRPKKHGIPHQKQAFRTGVLFGITCVASTVMMCQSGIITLLIHANPLVTREKNNHNLNVNIQPHETSLQILQHFPGTLLTTATLDKTNPSFVIWTSPLKSPPSTPGAHDASAHQ